MKHQGQCFAGNLVVMGTIIAEVSTHIFLGQQQNRKIIQNNNNSRFNHCYDVKRFYQNLYVRVYKSIFFFFVPCYGVVWWQLGINPSLLLIEAYHKFLKPLTGGLFCMLLTERRALYCSKHSWTTTNYSTEKDLLPTLTGSYVSS